MALGVLEHEALDRRARVVAAIGRRGVAVASLFAQPALDGRDPLVEVADGPFLEVPIASRRVGPAFFWKLACVKKLGGARHRAFGDGQPIALEGGDLLRKLHTESFLLTLRDGIDAAPSLPGYRLERVDPTTLEVEISKDQNLNDVFAGLSGLGLHVLSMRNKVNRLEEMFMRLVENRPA